MAQLVQQGCSLWCFHESSSQDHFFRQTGNCVLFVLLICIFLLLLLFAGLRIKPRTSSSSAPAPMPNNLPTHCFHFHFLLVTGSIYVSQIGFKLASPSMNLQGAGIIGMHRMNSYSTFCLGLLLPFLSVHLQMIWRRHRHVVIPGRAGEWLTHCILFTWHTVILTKLMFCFQLGGM